MLSSESELAQLESSKLANTAQDKLESTKDLRVDALDAVDEVERLDRRIKDMVLYLENHGTGSGSGISITNALRQASNILKNIQSKDFSEFDIKVRTELSNSR